MNRGDAEYRGSIRATVGLSYDESWVPEWRTQFCDVSLPRPTSTRTRRRRPRCRSPCFRRRRSRFSDSKPCSTAIRTRITITTTTGCASLQGRGTTARSCRSASSSRALLAGAVPRCPNSAGKHLLGMQETRGSSYPLGSTKAEARSDGRSRFTQRCLCLRVPSVLLTNPSRSTGLPHSELPARGNRGGAPDHQVRSSCFVRVADRRALRQDLAGQPREPRRQVDGSLTSRLASPH